MKQFVTIQLNWDLTMIVPLDKSAAILELMNDPTIWFEAAYNGRDDYPSEADQGRCLVPRKLGLIEAKIVAKAELDEQTRKGRLEEARRAKWQLAREAEREAKRLAEQAA